MNILNTVAVSLLLASSTSSYIFPGDTPSGFTYEDGTKYMYSFRDKSNGYGYYGIQLYSTPFAKNGSHYARLYLVRTIVDFTPGHVAYINDDTSFSYTSYLKRGYVHLTFGMYENEDMLARSSSFVIKNFTPLSQEQKTYTITSESGYEYNINKTITAGIDLANGLSLSESLGGGITVSYNNTYSTTTSYPTLSAQRAYSVDDQIQWSFDYDLSLGATTYSLDTYTFLIVYDNRRGYPDYAFSTTIDIQMVTAPMYSPSSNYIFNTSYKLLYNDELI